MKIIAECAINWHTLAEALGMILRAKEIGCWGVKFQIFNKENINNEDLFERLECCVLDKLAVKKLFEYGKKIGIEMLFTPMFPEAVNWCEAAGVNYYKIRYMDRLNLKLYRKLKNSKKTILVSCQNPRDTLYYNKAKYNNNIRFLFCIPCYPAPYNDYVMFYPQREKQFNGISDHTKDCRLLKYYKENYNLEYFEKHIRIHENEIEQDWTCTFNQLEEVIK